MAKQKDKQPSGQKISAKVVILGTIAFLLLAGICFNLGYYYMNSRIKVPAEPSVEVTSPPPATTAAEEQPQTTETEPSAPVEIDITETSEPNAAPENNNEITVTLKPEDIAAEKPAPEQVKPVEEQVKPVEEKPTPTTTPNVKPIKPTVENKPQAGDTRYRVQLGAFSDKENALKLVEDIKTRGHKVEIKFLQSGDQLLYRVQLSKTFKNRENAQKLADSLSTDNLKPIVLSEKKQN